MDYSLKAEATTKHRLASVDALRGFDMFFIMGLPALITAIAGLFGYGPDNFLSVQMRHVPWHGWRLMDGVFPVFLFISGITWPFSFASRISKGVSRSAICLNIMRRVFVLFVLGLMCEGITHIDLGWQAFRFGSVLGRIGFAWGAAALLYVFCSTRVRIAVAAVILIGYWLLLLNVPAPDAAVVTVPTTGMAADIVAKFGRGPFSLPGCLVGWVDRTVLPGRLRFDGLLDTQGLLSILPSICLPLFGGFAGDLIRREGISGGRKAMFMAVLSVALAATGWCMANCLGAWSMPFNRSLWTSSHILWSSGYAFALFAVFYYVIDVRGWLKWSFFFRVIGMNAIVIWMLTRLYGIGRYSKFDPLSDAAKWLFGGVATLVGGNWGAVVLALGYIAVCWSLLYFLYRKNIFIKV